MYSVDEVAFLLKNYLLTPVTPNDPSLTFDPVISVADEHI